MDDENQRVLEVVDLTKRYGEREAVRGVTFTVREGEIYGLLGPNGAGKTTTIGMIASVVPPSGGSIRILKRPAFSKSDHLGHRVGLVPQNLGLYPSLTADENLRFFGRVYGLHGKVLSERVETLLELMGLTLRRGDPVAIFSGGMQRRLNLACGLIHEPKLLLLDEPTVGVDPQSREHIFTAVEELASQGMAVLYTTHYMEEAERLCHRVAIMDEGRFLAEGTVQELANGLGKGNSISVVFKKTPTRPLIEKLAEWGARLSGKDRFIWTGSSAEKLVPDIFRIAADESNAVGELVVHRPNLGEVFLRLTGKTLRD